MATDIPYYNSVQSLLGGGYFMTGVTTFGLVQMAENPNPGVEITCSNPFSASPSSCPYQADGSFKSTPFGGLAYKSGSTYWYKNGDAGIWNTFDFSGGGGGGGGGGTPGGADGNVQYNGAGAFTGSGNFTWDNLFQKLTVTGIANTAAITVPAGYIESVGGMKATCSAFNCVQAPSGGMLSLTNLTTSGSLQLG
jgi:hypothetical protein